ncbi:MAG TPA: hypothetical protein VN256_03300 [Pyrinomonadaceae bacterium]|nr:hypothetical protein [Pyrinomonadaceae bacterium]
MLDRASESGRVLFTHDDDLLMEAARRQEVEGKFAGVIYAHQLNITVGQCIEDLELITQATESAEWIGRVTYLPLK